MTIEVGTVLVDWRGDEWTVDAIAKGGRLVVSRSSVVVDWARCSPADVGGGDHRRTFHLKSDAEPEHPAARRIRLGGWPSSTSEAFR